MNEFRILANKNKDFVWVFLFPLFFLIICTCVCLFPALPNESRPTYNMLLFVLGIVSGVFSLCLVCFLILFLIKPDVLVLVSMDKIRIFQSKESYKEFYIKEFKNISYRKFINNQETVLVFKFKDSKKKDLTLRYVLDANKIALYINQLIKNQ